MSSENTSRGDWVRLCAHIPPGPLALFFLQIVQVSRPVIWTIYTPIVVLLLVLDGVRVYSYYQYRSIVKKNKRDLISRSFRMWYKEWERRLLKGTIRERELGMFSAGPTYAFGIGLVALLYGNEILVPAVMFLALGDPTARIVGEKWGTQRSWLLGSSLAGCAGFFLAACGGAIIINVTAIWFPLYPCGITFGHIVLAQLVGIVVATIVEAYSPILDNMTIPLAAAVAMGFVL